MSDTTVNDKKTKRISKKTQTIGLYVEGKTREEIADIVYPDQTPENASSSISRALRSVNTQSFVQNALDANNIDIVELVAQYKEELQAIKEIYSKGEYIASVPDYGVRQKARDVLLKLMQAYTGLSFIPDKPPANPNGLDTNPDIDPSLRQSVITAIKNGDISAIERIVFADQKKDV